MARKGLTPREKSERDARERLKLLNATIDTLESTVKTLKIQARELARSLAEVTYQMNQPSSMRSGSATSAGEGRGEP